MEGLATLIVGRGCVERYQARISRPLLDRIDLQIELAHLGGRLRQQDGLVADEQV